VSTLIPGYRLDRYELLGPLAEGGMASVWIARQRGKHGFEKLVALKTILPQYASDMRFQQMFLDEARIASRIEHFNVARILDLGDEHDVLYLAMEYVDGDALSKLRRVWLKKKLPPPTGVILRVLADACSGLHEAHELRSEDGRPLEIVHRDVSPHNILVSVKGVAKVIDFGIAKARDRLGGETNAGVLKGKVQYMAPEQALGRNVDRRADVWAIGASMYHLLTGRPAYDADNTLGTLHLLTSGRPPVPLPPEIHPSIAALTRKALTTPPEKRYASAAEMRDAIEAAMVDAGVPTTNGDVASYVKEHLAERTAKRRQVIDIALAAAVERQRVEDLLRPAVEGATTGFGSPPSSGPSSAPTSSRTVPDVPYALAAPGSVPRPPLSAPVSSAPADSSTPFELELRRSQGRRNLLFGVLVAGAIAGAGAVTFAMLRSQRGETAPKTPIVLGTGASQAAPTAAALPPPPPSASVVPESIPVFSADSLPKATASQLAPGAVPPRAAPVRHPPPPPPASRKKQVDDGF
jgi:serine/threonine-protein kinase